LAATPELVASMLQVYREHEPPIVLSPDTRDVLDWGASRFNLGLITDGYAGVQERKIKALELERRIPCRIVTDALGREFWKPSPESYRRVMAHYAGPAGGFVYVADNPRKDFIGARLLGWRTIRLRRPGGEHAAYTATSAETADHDITSLAEQALLVEPAVRKP
jgi:putative hydrolase of the HAD superfamily